jgi:catechol 2,3-dioxygenase-like lactoylglutathione lyase family enzyme
MLDHVSIAVTDIGAAERFYDAIMSALGVPKVRKSELRLGYGDRCDGDHPDRNYLSIKIGDQPDDAPARHWWFKAPGRAAVDAFWKAGMANGGTDNGPPGATSTTRVTTPPS